MTPVQLTSFKNAILADASLAAARAAGDHGAIAAYYNAPATGFVWRPSISPVELNTAVDWAAFAALTAIKQNAFSAMIAGGTLDATSANIRAGFQAVFGAGATLTAVTALAQRVPTRFEALFAVSNVTPVFGQVVTVADIVAAMGA